MSKNKYAEIKDKIKSSNRLFFKEIKRSDNRSCAILGAAYLDAKLYLLLYDYLISDAVNSNHFLTNHLSAAKRINLTYLLGLICKNDYEDLLIINSIRNSFAHSLQGLTFDDDEIKSKLHGFNANKYNVGDDARVENIEPKVIFLMEIFYMLISIWIIQMEVENGNKLTSNTDNEFTEKFITKVFEKDDKEHFL